MKIQTVLLDALCFLIIVGSIWYSCTICTILIYIIWLISLITDFLVICKINPLYSEALIKHLLLWKSKTYIVYDLLTDLIYLWLFYEGRLVVPFIAQIMFIATKFVLSKEGKNEVTT